MTDTKLLKSKIKSSGLKLDFIGNALGLSRYGLYRKINGLAEFKASEISKLTELLGLTMQEQKAIFFAS